jgi:hypothetical protein
LLLVVVVALVIGFSALDLVVLGLFVEAVAVQDAGFALVPWVLDVG